MIKLLRYESSLYFTICLVIASFSSKTCVATPPPPPQQSQSTDPNIDVNSYKNIRYFNHNDAQIFVGPGINNIHSILREETVAKFIDIANTAPVKVEYANCVARAYQFGHALIDQNLPEDVATIGQIVIYESKAYDSTESNTIPACWKSTVNDTYASHHALCYASAKKAKVYVAFDHGVRYSKKNPRNSQVYIGSSPEELTNIIHERYMGKASGLLAVGQNFSDAKSGNFPMSSAALSQSHKAAIVEAPMNFPAHEGFLDIVQKLARTSPESLEAQDEYGMMPLHHAIMGNSVPVVKFLLEQSSSTIPLHHTSQIGAPIFLALNSKPAILQLLIDKDKTLLDSKKQGDTLLHRSLNQYSLESFYTVVNNMTPEQLDKPNGNGDTALHIAVQRGETEAVNYLLAHGANPDIQNSDGYTARMLANQASKEPTISISFIARSKIKRALLPCVYSQHEFRKTCSEPSSLQLRNRL